MTYEDALTAVRQNAYDNNMWSAQMAANNMNFQMNMANTAHQREVADLKAAGLNPVLSAHTNGAAVTSGAMAQPDTGSTGAIQSIFEKAMDQETAMALQMMKGTGYGTGSFGNAKNQYYFKDGWMKILEDLVEGATGMPMDQAMRKAGHWAATTLPNTPAGKWVAKNLLGIDTAANNPRNDPNNYVTTGGNNGANQYGQGNGTEYIYVNPRLANIG